MRLPKLSRYACYYGTGRLPALTAYDLVILQALHYTPAEIAWLRQRQVIPIAYLALGEEPSSTPRRSGHWLTRRPAGSPTTPPGKPPWSIAAFPPGTLISCRREFQKLLRAAFRAFFWTRLTCKSSIRTPGRGW